MAINAGSVFIELGAKVDYKEFAAYDRELHKVREKARQREAYKTKLGADYDPRAFNAYYRGLDKAERQTKTLERTHGKLTSALKNTAGLALAAGGLTTLSAAISSTSKAYAESQKSQVEMERQLKASGTSYAAHKKQIDSVIASVSNLAAVDDEDLQGAFTRLLRATGDVNESLKLSKVATDLAAGGHIDLSRAAIIVSKVWDGNTKALSRYGINLEKSTQFVDALKGSHQKYTREQLYAAQAADKQKNSVEGLAAVQKKFAGQAEAYGKTQAGAQARLANSFQNLQESIGQATGPFLTKASNALAKFFDQMRTGTGTGGQFAKVVKDIGTQLGGIVHFLKTHTTLVKIAAAAWVTYKVAALGAAAAGRAAALGGALGRGGAAAGAARGAGAAGAAAGGVGILGGVATAGIAAGAVVLSNVLQDLHKKSDNASQGFAKAIDYAKKLGAQGNINGIRRLADSVDDFGHANGASAKQIDKVKGALDDYARNLEGRRRLTRSVTADIGRQFARMADETGGSLKDINKTVALNMRTVKINLGARSAEGKEALAANFRAAIGAIRGSMKSGAVATDDGLREIRRLMTQELKLYGLSGGQVKDYLRTSGHGSGNEAAGGGHAQGGWIGQRGQSGGDSVPIMVGVGEAVLNRHQQGIIESLLGEGFLDRLFATVNRPHFMARGGRVQGFAGGGVAGAMAAANQFERAGFPYRLGGGHERSPTPFEPVDCSGAVSYVLQHAGVKIPTMVSGQLARAGKPGAGPLTVFANPVHTFMRIGARYFGTSGSNPGGGAGFFDDPGAAYKSRFAVRHFDAGDGLGIGSIGAPRVSGGGLVGAIVQGALRRAAGAANGALNSAVSSMGLGTGDPGDPGPTPRGSYSKTDLARLWTGAGGPRNVASLMAAIALAESNGNPRAHNPSGATGLWQILGNPFPGDAYNPATNARMAVAKYHSQGLGAWEAYTNGSYRRYLSRGGRPGAVRGFARGGRPSVADILKLKLAKGYGVDVYNNEWDIYSPGSDFGPGLQAASSKLGQRMVRAQIDTPDDYTDDLPIARWAENMWRQVYFNRVARRAPAGKIKAAALKLGEARSNVAGIQDQIQAQADALRAISDQRAEDFAKAFAPKDTTPDMQALLDQANNRNLRAAANIQALQRTQQAFSSSGDIGFGGFGNAYQAAAGAPRIIINTLHPGDPQTLTAIGNAATAGQSLQSYVPATRSKVGV